LTCRINKNALLQTVFFWEILYLLGIVLLRKHRKVFEPTDYVQYSKSKEKQIQNINEREEI